ncbi:hypothetical protein CCB80_03015 [Armatimonadetes bacterium Uphvl-Ar1]|nr:hypothetical protein CCB80_03015 [Armatimonadetes bacterium Uphvl-Ar1]
MTNAILLLAMISDEISVDRYLIRHNLPVLMTDARVASSRTYSSQRISPPVKLLLEVSEIDSKEQGYAGFQRRRDNSPKPSGFDNLPRAFPNGLKLGFVMIHSKNKVWKEDSVRAFGNHVSIRVTVSGLLMPTQNPGEVKEVEPAPQNTESIATNLATLFIAEQEAYNFAPRSVIEDGFNFQVLIGLDGTQYYSLKSYAAFRKCNFSLNPDSGAGVLESNPPLVFNLGSRDYRWGEEERMAEHIVVLSSNDAFLPKEMLTR